MKWHRYARMRIYSCAGPKLLPYYLGLGLDHLRELTSSRRAVAFPRLIDAAGRPTAFVLELGVPVTVVIQTAERLPFVAERRIALAVVTPRSDPVTMTSEVSG